MTHSPLPRVEGVMQIAYLVPDIQKAIHHWVTHFKVGPWFVAPHFTGTDKRYRGAATDVDMSVAMAYWNDMNIELIQQLNDAPSVYRDVIDKRGYGFHHWGVCTKDFEGEVERYRAQGLDVAFSTRVRSGSRIAFFDTTATLPGMVEVIETTDATTEMFSSFYRASIGWDGRDPIRSR